MEHKQYQIGGMVDEKQKVSEWIFAANIFRTDKDLNIKDRHIFNDQQQINRLGQTFGRTAFSGSVYSASTSDYLIGITSLVVAPSIGLPKPSLAGVGKTFVVKDEVGGAGTTTITIRSAGEETIDGASTSTIATNYGAKSYYTDGTNWFTK